LKHPSDKNTRRLNKLEHVYIGKVDPLFRDMHLTRSRAAAHFARKCASRSEHIEDVRRFLKVTGPITPPERDAGLSLRNLRQLNLHWKLGFHFFPFRTGAFSCEADKHSRDENASKQKFGAAFRSDRNARTLPLRGDYAQSTAASTCSVTGAAEFAGRYNESEIVPQ
jgi:hypothetical protein